jgi:DNA polymerase
MAERAPASGDDLARQAQQHLAGLKAAGVEWVPRAPARPRRPAARPGAKTPPASAAPEVGASGNLFAVADQPPDQPLEERRRELEVLSQRVAGCTRCPELAATRRNTVFGVGSPGVELCFVGEAPGGEEDARGEPFVGPAGQLLNRIIAACGMQREDVYICNIIKCRPPGNRTPLPNECGNCREYFERQLELVRPKFICALGAVAAQNLLGSTLSIGKMRGRFLEYRGIPVMCTYHPAFLLRSPERKRDVWEDMKLLLAKMGRPVK